SATASNCSAPSTACAATWTAARRRWTSSRSAPSRCSALIKCATPSTSAASRTGCASATAPAGSPPTPAAAWGGTRRAPASHGGRRVGWEPAVFRQARRLAEAGVPVVTLAVGSWDHHSPKDGIFSDLRTMVPLLDWAVHGLVTDLCDRGLDRDVAVVILGEMGRTPEISPAA